jgi:hypothetical protein
MEMSGQHHSPATFTPQEKSPLDRRLGKPHSLSRYGGEEKSSQPFPGLEPLIIHPVAQHYATKLSQLLIMNHYET